MKKERLQLIAIFWVTIILISSCSSIKLIATSRDINQQLKRSEVFSTQFTGFVLYDPLTKEYLKDYNGDLHFTPASNAKILTAAACLTSFGDSIPSFKIRRGIDTLQIEPFGDPTFLHPDFPSQPTIAKLSSPHLRIVIPENSIEAFGPGWAWDDYQYDFQNERAIMPIYGNMIRLTSKNDVFKISPEFFTDFVTGYTELDFPNFRYRDPSYNIFGFKKPQDTVVIKKDIPFKYSEDLLLQLLRDTLNTDVRLSDDRELAGGYTIYNSSTLQAVALMMQRSDNFLAEQLLIVSARQKGYRHVGSYRSALINQWDLPASTQWVDGSGLSRYNLVSPKSLVKVLEDIYEQNTWEIINLIFPTGGVSGTIRNWYSGNPPYVFAKTGTLSNNHSLSGFIKTNSGKTLIFSLMNNNYTRSVTEVKLEMTKILEAVRDAY